MAELSFLEGKDIPRRRKKKTTKNSDSEWPWGHLPFSEFQVKFNYYNIGDEFRDQTKV